MTVIVATVIWLAVIGLIVFRNRGVSDHTTIYAMIAVGVGMTLNLTPAYLFFDGLLGGRNACDLIANTMIILGVSSLARGVAKASDASLSIKVFLGPYVAGSVVAASIVAFFWIQTDGSSARFMIDYGDQLAAGLYSGIQHLYFGMVLVALVIVCLGELGKARRTTKAVLVVLIVGSVIQVATCADVIVMDISHVVGDEELLSLGQSYYDYGNSTSFVLMTAGLVLLPGVRFFDSRRRRTDVSRLLAVLAPAWQRATAGAPLRPAAGTPIDEESLLYRQLVEIRDAQSSLGVEFHLSEEETMALDRAEELMLGSTAKPSRR